MESPRPNAVSSPGPVSRWTACALPYVAVILGMYVLQSGWISILLYHAGMLLHLAVWRPNGLARYAREGFPMPAGILLTLGCALAGGLVWCMWPIFGVGPDVLTAALTAHGFTSRSLFVFMMYLGTVHGVLEELYWRSLTRDTRQAVSGYDLAFAGYHGLVLIQFVPITFTAIAIVLLATVSALWRYAARRCGGIALTMLTHAVADASILAVVYVLADF